MSEMTTLYFGRFCRLCFANNDTIIDFNNYSYDKITYLNKIKQIIPILIHGQESIFPTGICKICQEKVNEFYEFTENCLNKHKLLHQYYLQLSSIDFDSNLNKFEDVATEEVFIKCESDEDIPLSKLTNTIVEDEKTPKNPPEKIGYSEESRSEVDDNEEDNISLSSINIKNEIDNSGTDSSKMVIDEQNFSGSSSLNNVGSDQNIEEIIKDYYQPSLDATELPNFRSWNNKCALCNKQYSCTPSLKKHYCKRHLTSKQFPCPHCGKNYSDLSSVKFHIKVYHLNQFKYRCHLCSKKFPTGSDLHMHVQSKVHRFNKCILCNVSFGDHELMQEHMSSFHVKVDDVRRDEAGGVATEGSPDVLDNQSTTTTNQENNLNTDTNNDALKSDKNSKTVSSLPNFKDWNGQCQNCPKKYASFLNLRRHFIRVHTERNSYECGTCGNIYASKYGLIDHKNAKHLQIKKYFCLICQKRFGFARFLLKHAQKHRNVPTKVKRKVPKKSNSKIVTKDIVFVDSELPSYLIDFDASINNIDPIVTCHPENVSVNDPCELINNL